MELTKVRLANLQAVSSTSLESRSNSDPIAEDSLTASLDAEGPTLADRP